MRKLLAVLTVATLVAVAPVYAAPAAAAGPDATTINVSGSINGVSLTCDTSAYPAEHYPCDFAAVVTVGCAEVTVLPLATQCTLAVRGTLRATPSLSPTGRCTITAWENLVVTFVSGADPSFRIEQNEVATVVPQAGAYVLAGGYQTGFTITVVSPYVIGEILPEPTAGSVATNVVFSDLQHDCRNRFGGDPAIDRTAGGRGPTGSLTFVRPA